MSIDPLKSGLRGASAPGVSRTGSARDASARPAEDASEGTDAPDRLELSSAAAGLAPLADAGQPPALLAERLRTILQRLEGGYYDRPEVQTEVARRLQGDLPAE